MRGKVTYRHPQQARHFEHGVAPLPAATLDTLRDALGWALVSQLAPHDHYAAARIVESARFYRDRVHANAADRKATLAALAKEPDDKVVAALDACDPTTRAHVWDGAFLHLGMSAAEFAEPSNVKAAACAALAHFHLYPRKTHLHALAENCAALWRKLGGAPYSGAVNPGKEYADPLVRFSAALFEASGNPRSASAVARLLHAVMRGPDNG